MQRLSKHNRRLWKALRENVWARFTSPDLICITKLGLSPLTSVKLWWCNTSFSVKITVNEVQYLQESSLKRQGQWVL